MGEVLFTPTLLPPEPTVAVKVALSKEQLSSTSAAVTHMIIVLI